MFLYFDNGYNKREIARVESQEEAIKHINKFCEERDFKIYYIRYWHITDDWNRKYINYDVGSHTQFFCLSEQELIEPVE